MDEILDYYAKVKEPAKSCLLALRQVILQEDKAVTETIKWGMPCFCGTSPFCALIFLTMSCFASHAYAALI